MWYRVFALTDNDIQPAELLQHLQQHGLAVSGHFRGDQAGWFELELVLDSNPVTVERYLASEEGVRAILNTWAGWVETHESLPGAERIMEQLINTRQVFVMQIADEARDGIVGEMCRRLCEYLAGKSRGFIQVDGEGLYEAEGSLLIPESS